MEKNNRILIVAVLILLLGVITFNFNSISGAQTRVVVPTIRVSPSSGVCDDYGYGSGRVAFDFILEGNVQSADDTVKIYKVVGSRRYRITSEDLSSGSYAKAGTYKVWLSCDEGKYGGKQLQAGLRIRKTGEIVYSNPFNIRFI